MALCTWKSKNVRAKATFWASLANRSIPSHKCSCTTVAIAYRSKELSISASRNRCVNSFSSLNKSIKNGTIFLEANSSQKCDINQILCLWVISGGVIWKKGLILPICPWKTNGNWQKLPKFTKKINQKLATLSFLLIFLAVFLEIHCDFDQFWSIFNH